jgi:hypothetical protein
MDRQQGYDWRKASYSNGSGNCVEIGNASPVVMVRDTTDRDGVTLSVPTDAWSTFLAGIKHS